MIAVRIIDRDLPLALLAASGAGGVHRLSSGRRAGRIAKRCRSDRGWIMGRDRVAPPTGLKLAISSVAGGNARFATTLASEAG